MQGANNKNDAQDRKSGDQKSFDGADNTGRSAGSSQDTKAPREEAMEDIEQDPDLNNQEPFKDLDEGEAARMGVKDKDSA